MQKKRWLNAGESSLLTVRPVLCGCDSLSPFKGVAELALTGKARGEADVLYGQGGVFEQIPCSVHAGVENVFMGSEAGLPFKDADKMIIAEADQ